MFTQGELLYEFPSYGIAVALLALMLVAIHLGGRVGRRVRTQATEASKGQANSVQASLLGLLALMLGFTFSLSLGRFESRSVEVVEEANAIGTAWLRTDLLADARRAEAKALMRDYAALRVKAADVSAADDEADRARLVIEAQAVFARLWRLAADEARATPTPAAASVVASLNEMIDALGRRDAAINRHVPELVLVLLLATFVLLGGVVGYSSAISNVRPGAPVYAMMVLIVVLVFLILDLDRPRRGLIRVDQSPLVSVAAGMGP